MNRFDKKRLIIVICVCIISAAVIFCAWMFIFSEKAKENAAIRGKNYEQLVDIWNSDPQKYNTENVSDTLRAILDELYGLYSDGNDTGDEILEKIQTLEKFEIEELSDISCAYAELITGDEQFKANNYEKALESYNKALEYDNTLEEANGGLEKAEEYYIDEILKAADEYVNNEKFESAITEIEDALVILPDNQLLAEKLNDVKAKFEEFKEKNKAVNVKFEHNIDSSGESAVIYGVNTENENVWTIETDIYSPAELDRITEIGLNGDVYYYVEDGTVKAIRLEDGALLWENDEFKGSETAAAFGEDGTVYICGWYGPHFFAVDNNGNTLCRIDVFDEDYFRPYMIQCSDGYAVVTMEGSVYGEEAEIIVNLSDYSYTLPERKQEDIQQDSSGSNDYLSEEEIYERLVAHYSMGTEDASGSELVVMQGSISGSVYSTSVRTGVPGNPAASQRLYDVMVDITTGEVTQTRVLTDNKVTTFNIMS